MLCIFLMMPWVRSVCSVIVAFPGLNHCSNGQCQFSIIYNFLVLMLNVPVNSCSVI